jgi:hypothetical protein
MVATLIPEYFLLMPRNMSYPHNLKENQKIKSYYLKFSPFIFAR